VTQLFVIVQVLLAQCHTVDVLRQHLGKFMLDALGSAPVLEAGRHTW
jgi:hypothetical protein